MLESDGLVVGSLVNGGLVENPPNSFSAFDRDARTRNVISNFKISFMFVEAGWESDQTLF